MYYPENNPNTIIKSYNANLSQTKSTLTKKSQIRSILSNVYKNEYMMGGSKIDEIK